MSVRDALAQVGHALRFAYEARRAGPPPPPTVALDVAALSFDAFERLYEPNMVNLTLSGESHPEIARMIALATHAGSRVTLISDGTIGPGRAFALIDAGLACLEITVHSGDPEEDPGLERVIRSIEKLVAMRDANRKPGPVVELVLLLTEQNVEQLARLIEVCHSRTRAIEPSVLLSGPPDARVHTALWSARERAGYLGLRRTQGSIDAALGAHQRERPSRYRSTPSSSDRKGAV